MIKQAILELIARKIEKNISDNKIFFDEGHKIPMWHTHEKEVLQELREDIEKMEDKTIQTIDEMIEEFHVGFQAKYSDPVITLQELKKLLLNQ